MMYDLIIVGAGTAGCVLAERLSRSGKVNTLLIEAGARPNSRFVTIPAGFPKLFKTQLDWAFESGPQTAVRNRRIFTPRGKMLGGSSNMNAQIHQWCHPADFDEWESAGAVGWGWNDVSGVFREQESWIGDDGDEVRGRTGPMIISPNKNCSELARSFVDAAYSAGFKGTEHYNGHAFEGAWVCELAHSKGKRFSAYDAYLKPATGRRNLEVVTGAQAACVEIDNGQVTGVCVLRNGAEQVFAANAVVLAAGAFGSPLILKRSGIGPEDELRRHGIDVRFHSPEVGENLQDHPIVPAVFGTNTRETLLSAESIGSVLRYLMMKKGMLASNGVEAFAFIKTDLSQTNAPDLELLFVPMEFRREFLEPPQVHGFTIGAAAVKPLSRGQLLLKSADPFDPPLIDFGIFTDPDGIDEQVVWEGIRISRLIAETEPLASFNTGEIRPGADAADREELMDYAARELQTVYHPTSTCRMGSDANAVVDSRLRVNGVRGLWVADASVMPSVPRGHPNAVVAMIANRASEWISESLF